MLTATYSPEDNKLRLYSVARLDTETYKRVKAAGFGWAPKQELFVAPMWTPGREDLLLELCGEIGDEDTSLVDQQEQRAERFAEYSESRAEDANQAHAAVSRICDGIPLGQPILVGHHSEKHARKDAERIDNGMRRAVKMWETSKYWKSRAAGAIAHAKYKELPAVRHRRIKGLETDLRREQKRKDEHQDQLNNWNHPGLTHEQAARISNYDHISMCFPGAEFPRKEGQRVYEGEMSLWSALNDEIITAEQARGFAVPSHERGIVRADRWIQHLNNRLEYERAMLAESGGTAADNFDIQPGGRVLTGGEWLVVLKVNKVGGAANSVSITPPRGVTWAKSWKIGIEQVKDYRAPEGDDAAKVAAAIKLPPLCNYPGEGFRHILKAEWDRKCSDYKSTRTVKSEQYGAHRVRFGMFAGYKNDFVYLTDVKRVEPPMLTPPAEPVSFAREFTEEALQPKPQRQPEQPSIFDAMKEQIKHGVQVVTAPQLFPTPANLAARMVELADIQHGQEVLEPSAGTGAIVDAICNEEPTARITAVEINNSLCRRLNTMPPVYRTVEADFLTCNGDLGKFDRVLMNPPFADGQDIKHILHAITMLKPGGRLVAICANGPRQNEKLRPVVEGYGGEWEVLPADTFKDQGTSVNTVLLSLSV